MVAAVPHGVTKVDVIHAVPLDLIDATGRLRAVDEARVQVIMDSIMARRDKGESGLDQAVTVRPIDEGRFKLVIGGHRLEAVRRLGDKAIDARIRMMTEAEARLAEIDENLARAELTKLDRAAFLAERDVIWKMMHPDKVGKGKAAAAARWHHATENTSFASEVKDLVGLSDKQIRNDVNMFRALAPEVISRIRGTWLADHQAQLKALAKMGPKLQLQVVETLLRADNPPANVSAARAEIEGHRPAQDDTTDAGFKKLLAAWNRAPAKDRNAFLCWLADEGVLKTFMDGE